MSASPLEGKALITGASGFIGGRLRDALLERGLDVVAIRRKSSSPSKKGRSVEVEYSDLGGLEKVMETERPDYVFHVAGATKGVTYEDFQLANVMPTENLLQAAIAKNPGIKRFVLVSSLASYGPSSPNRPHVETDTPRPIEHYGKSKLEAESKVIAVKDAVPWTILRPGGVYGPGDVDYFNLFREADKGRNMFFGNRHKWFSAIYVDDVVSALEICATHDSAVGKGFFLCDGEPITWEQFQMAVVEGSGKRVRTMDLPGALVNIAAFGGELLTRFDKKPRLFNQQKAIMGAQEAWTCKSDALRSATGWKSVVSVPEGVRRAFEWYRREKWF